MNQNRGASINLGTLSLPHLVGGEGALAAIHLPLDAAEEEALRRSAGVLRAALESLKL